MSLSETGTRCIRERMRSTFSEPKKRRIGGASPNPSLMNNFDRVWYYSTPLENRRLSNRVYSDFFSPGAEASSLPIPTFDLISLMK